MTPFTDILEEDNRRINQWVRLTTANCVLDYWSRKDVDYVNHVAPEMGYVECEWHGPEIGPRPYGGKALCPECGDEMIYAIRAHIISQDALYAVGGWDSHKKRLRPLVVAHKQRPAAK